MKILKKLRTPNNILVIALIGYLFIIIFSVFSNPGAIYLTDELGYASKAAHLAGHSNLLSSSWHAGYSIMLAPIFMAFGTNEIVWPAISILNLALTAGSIIFWISTLYALGYKRKKAILISLSSLVCFSVWGFTSWIFVNPALQLIIAIMARGLLLHERIPRLLTISIVGGIAYWIHPTGLLIASSAWIIAIAEMVSIQRKQALKALALTAIGIAITIVLIIIYQKMHSVINISMGGDGGHYDKQISGYINELNVDTKQTIAEIGTGLINGLANLSIATFGYSMLFLAEASGRNKREEGYLATNKMEIMRFIGVVTISLLLFSSLLAINKPNDYQHMLHQRYTAPVIQSLWILGLAQWIDKEKTINMPNRLILCVSPVLLALIIGSVRWNYNDRFSIIDAMSSGTSVISNALKSQNQPLASLAIGSIVIIMVQSLSWRPKLILAGIFSSIVGLNANNIRGENLKRGSKQPDLIGEVKKLSNTKRVCLAALKTGLSAGESDNLHEFYLSSRKIIRLRNRYEDRISYSSFYDPDPTNCDYIFSPLDIHLTTHRSDLVEIIHKLETCQIVKVDDRLGWGLSECKDTKQDKTTKFSFITSSNGAETAQLNPSTKPVRVYTKDKFNYKNTDMTFGYLSKAGDTSDVASCTTLNNKKMRQSCQDKKEVIMETSPEIPLIWGIYIQDLRAGKYQLIPNGLKVYKGEVTMEIIDTTINRLNSEDYQASDASISNIPFTLSKDKEHIELRIEASANAIFTPPSHLIITQ